METRDIDLIIAEFSLRHPSVSVTQLKVTHRADDDGIWFFRLGETEVQIESSTGNCPFLIESNKNSDRTTSADILRTSRSILEQLGIIPDSPLQAPRG
jgi:hypothetical protein